MKPYLDAADILEIKKILRAYADTGRRLQILEWGAGGSTLTFPRFLQKLGADFRWTAIEHNPKWHGRLRAKAAEFGKLVRIHLIPLEPQPDAYANLTRFSPDARFDIVIVDGRFRRRCLLRALDLLEPGGLVVLHDAERRWYHCSTEIYPHSKLIPKDKKTRRLWLGCLDPKKVPVEID